MVLSDRVAQHLQKSSSHLKILGAKNGDMKQVPYQEPTNIRCHYTKFSRYGDLA